MSTSLKILLYGYGGHGRVMADCLQEAGFMVSTVFDDNPVRDCPFPFAGPYAPEEQPDIPLLISIGDNALRRRLAEKVQHNAGTFVHASALLSPQAHIGAGSMVLKGTIIQTGVLTGRHCIINSGAIVEHDCSLKDYVHIAPGAILCGAVSIGEGSLVGAGAVVLPGISIGKDCVVGAGSVVTRSLPDGSRCCGNPARPF